MKKIFILMLIFPMLISCHENKNIENKYLMEDFDTTKSGEMEVDIHAKKDVTEIADTTEMKEAK